MQNGNWLASAAVASMFIFPMVSEVVGQIIPVEIRSEDGAYRLWRGEQPYGIRGVGGQTRLAAIRKAGGNSIRTWSPDGLEKLLEEAQRHELTVCVGLWLGHQRHGFDYQNEAAVRKQYEECLQTVQAFKDHPAVLLWAIGNEMEGDGRNPAVWYAVNHIARGIKAVDPHHPTMTVVAELGENEEKPRNIQRYCPDVDIVGINSYGGIETLGERYRRSGCKKPYIVTEHGPRGPWEVSKTRWGAPLEPSSTKKADLYGSGYQKAVVEQAGLCLGSYCFLWGHKQETTATWFGMLLPDGSKLAAVDTMSKLWTGAPPPNSCPIITSILADRTDLLKPGELVTVTVLVDDPDGDVVSIEWVLREDSGIVGVGGDWQPAAAMTSTTIQADGPRAEVTVPDSGGGYRLFAYVRDDKHGAAVANIPLYVDAAPRRLPAAKATFPLVVYGDDAALTYVPSGYMGNTEAIRMTPSWQERPHTGSTCLKVEYVATDQWGGVIWQSPANDWDGEKPGGFDLTGAKALEFWARGEKGTEIINFMFGILDGEQAYRDTAKGELKEVPLSTDWQRLRIPVEGCDLQRIKTGFGWSCAGSGEPVTFFLDDVRYVEE